MQEEDNYCRVCFRGVYSCHWKLSSNSKERVSVCRHAKVDSYLVGCSQGLAEHHHDFRGLTRCQRAVLLSSSNIFYIMRNAGIIVWFQTRECLLIKYCDKMLAATVCANENRRICRSKQVSCKWKGCLIVVGGSRLWWSASKFDAIKSMKIFWNSV